VELLERRWLLSATLWVDHASHSAFQTIQAAVNAAQPGDTIKVAPGTYVESVSISTKDLTLLGGQIHLSGEKGASIVESDSNIFLLGANNITIKGFTLEPATAAGDEAAGGVLISSGTGDSIQNNVFDGIGFCILVFTPGNTVSGNIVNNCVEGVDVTAGGNAVSGNTIDVTSDSGISVVTSGSSTVTGNTVTSADQGDVSGAGINILAGALATVTGNTAESNTGAGIVVDASTGAAIVQNNKATGNSADGIDISSVTATVSHNVADNNGGNGFIINTTGAATVTANTTDGNGVAGVNLTAGTANITLNTADQNGDFGIAVIATSATMTGNTADNDLVGIDTSGETNFLVFNDNQGDGSVIGLELFTTGLTTVSGNTANDNIDGFIVFANSENMKGNTASFNSSFGFELVIGPGTISDNTADSNGGTGFIFKSRETPTGVTTVAGNTASNNAGDGFSLQMFDDGFFTGNTARSNGNDGIEVDAFSAGNVFAHNTALKNGAFDLADESGGSGTDGTANTWIDNTFKTSSPAGLH
jgi:parallel beta-helix repeat protein